MEEWLRATVAGMVAGIFLGTIVILNMLGDIQQQISEIHNQPIAIYVDTTITDKWILDTRVPYIKFPEIAIQYKLKPKEEE